MSVRIYFETYGCQMNVADTERARMVVQRAGMELAAEAGDADVVLLNTCSVRDKAERKVLSRVYELHHLQKEKGGTPQIMGVMGCVGQLSGGNLFEDSKQVRLVLGTQAIERLPELISEAKRQGNPRVLDLGERTDDSVWDVPLSVRHSPVVAFVPIIEGCNKFCSYCIVPYARGREQSRPAKEIVAEVKRLLGQGVREIHLIGQNVNSYRPGPDSLLDSYKGATPFVQLLRAVAATEIPRIKFTTSFPRDFHRDILQALEEHDNLCNWVHLPVQSGSDRILKAMRRGYTREDYLAKIELIKKSPKDIALTTDIIIGYPGETAADFAATLSLFRLCAFDSAYLFKYSPRPGTPAYQAGDTIPEAVKTERFAEIQQLQRDFQKSRQEAQLGKTLSVLVETQSPKNVSDLKGHSTCQRIVNFPNLSNNRRIGDIVPVTITATRTNSLYGEAPTA